MGFIWKKKLSPQHKANAEGWSKQDIQLRFISPSCLFWVLFTWAWARKGCRVVSKPLFAFHFTKITFHLPFLWVWDKGTAPTAELLFCLLLFILSVLHGTRWINDSPSTAPPDCDPIVTSLLGLVLTGSSLKSLLLYPQFVPFQPLVIQFTKNNWDCWEHPFLGSHWKVAEKAVNLSYHGNLPFWGRAYIVAGSSSASCPHLPSSLGSCFLAPISPRPFHPTKYGEQWYPGPR